MARATLSFAGSRFEPASCFAKGELSMFARNPLCTLVGLALLLAVVSIAWVPPEPAVAPRAPAFESVAASNVGPEIIISERNSAEYSPAIAYNSKHNEYLVVWENDWGGGYHDIYAQRISGSGQLLSWFALTTVHSQTNPAVAYDPVNDRYLVVWAYDSYGDGSNWDVYGRFVPWNGPPNPADFPICTWPSNQGHPAVAYGRAQQEFLVVWKSEATGVPGYISARRVFAAGGFPPGDGFTISSGTQIRDFPDVAYNLARNEYLVTWDLELSASNIDIWGMRLRGDGVPLTGGSPTVTGEFAIAGWPSFEAAPAVAACAAADQYLVAWQSDQGPYENNYAIYARYLNGDAVPGHVYEIDDTTSPELNVDVDCNLAGDRYLLAWQTRYANPQHYGIWARTAWPNESLPPQFAVKLPGTATDREYPAVAGGRTGYLVAWEHQRDSGGNRDIHGRLLQYAVHLPLLLR
jgi:hypothetical protein